MKRLLFTPLILFIYLPCFGGEKEVVTSQLSSFEKANSMASVKTVIDCRSNLEGPFSEEEKNEIYKVMGLNPIDLSGPLVKLLSKEFKKYIADNCRSFNKVEVARAAMRITNEYDLRFSAQDKKQVKIPIVQFGQTAGIIATAQCKYDKGFYKTKKESTDAMGLAFRNTGIPLSYTMNLPIQYAALAIKEFMNSDCTNFNVPKEQIGAIIYNYFNEQ